MLCACAARAPVAPPQPAFPLHEDWRVEISQAAELAARMSLATDGESVFLAPSADTLQALDAATGQERWRVTAAPGVLAARPGLLVVKHPEGLVDGFDSRSGRAIWTLKTGIAGEVPPLVTERYVVLAGRGLALLDAASGEKLWSVRGLGRFTTSPLVVGPRILAGTEEGNLYCLDLATGKVLWSYRSNVAWVCPPVVDGDGRVLLGTSNGLLLGISLWSGQRLWQRRIGAETAQPGVLVKNVVCFGSFSAVLQALNRSNGNFVWRSGLPSRPLSMPFLRGDLIFVACYGGRENLTTFVAVDAKTGKRQGVFDLPGEIVGPPLFVADRFVVALRSGAVVGLSLAQVPAPEQPSPSPAAGTPGSAPSPEASPSPTPRPALRP
jgi:outer membrane protein assembly factor BamB